MRLLFAFIFIACATVAHAEKFTLEQVLSLQAAHAALDGHERAIKDGQSEKVIRESYKFTVQFRVALARNVTALKQAVETYRAAYNGLIAEVSGGKGSVEKSTPQEMQLLVRHNELLKTQLELPLVRFKMKELNLEANTAIPASVLSGLDPILDE